MGSSRTRARTCVQALAGGFLTTAPSGKSRCFFFLNQHSHRYVSTGKREKKCWIKFLFTQKFLCHRSPPLMSLLLMCLHLPSPCYLHWQFFLNLSDAKNYLQKEKKKKISGPPTWPPGELLRKSVYLTRSTGNSLQASSGNTGWEFYSERGWRLGVSMGKGRQEQWHRKRRGEWEQIGSQAEREKERKFWN